MDDDSSEVREGALACLWVLLSDTFLFGCIKRSNNINHGKEVYMVKYTTRDQGQRKFAVDIP